MENQECPTRGDCVYSVQDDQGQWRPLDSRSGVSRTRQLIEPLAFDTLAYILLAASDDVNPLGSGQKIQRFLMPLDVLVDELGEDLLHPGLLDSGTVTTSTPPMVTINFAFLGQFAEAPKDCVFTVEYSVRCAEMGVYGLFETGKQVTPVYDSIHRPDVLIKAVQSISR